MQDVDRFLILGEVHHAIDAARTLIRVPGGAGVAAQLQCDRGGGDGGVAGIEKSAGNGLGQGRGGKDKEGQQEMHRRLLSSNF